MHPPDTLVSLRSLMSLMPLMSLMSDVSCPVKFLIILCTPNCSTSSSWRRRTTSSWYKMQMIAENMLLCYRRALMSLVFPLCVLLQDADTRCGRLVWWLYSNADLNPGKITGTNTKNLLLKNSFFWVHLLRVTSVTFFVSLVSRSIDLAGC